jgi:hypothetical protein
MEAQIRGSLQYFHDKYYNPTDVQMYNINIARWRLLKVLFLVNLDTLSLKEFLPYIPISNGSTIDYMVGNIISRPFQWYMEFPITP